MKEREEMLRCLARAKDHLIRAAAALTDLPMAENRLFALHEAALGIMELAKSDPDHEVCNRYIEILKTVQERGQKDGP